MRTREDLIVLIAKAIRANITYIEEAKARACASTILSWFKGEKLRIIDGKKPDPSPNVVRLTDKRRYGQR